MVSKQLAKVFLLTLFWIFLLNLLNITTRSLIFDRTSYQPLFGIRTVLSPVITPWVNFDGLNYLKIILTGYDVQNVVFFPLFPLIVYILSFVFQINPVLLGFLFTNAVTFLCVVLIYKLVKLENSDTIALRVVFILLTFPTAVFIFAY